MAFLYINSKGNAWRKHSYSAGNEYDQSPLKYFLRRVMGWREKENKARFLFGKALEQAIQWHHDHEGYGAVDAFKNFWLPFKDRDDLLYTQVEKDWETLNLDGIEMVKLYLIKLPSLPIPLGGCSAFQREYKKEVFPGDPTYGEIEDAGICDVIAYVSPDHPMLDKNSPGWTPEQGAYRPVIIDIKTSGTDFPEQPGIASFDKQLRRYSWLTGIRDVALLGFRKVGRTIKKGNTVTLLEDMEKFKAGEEAVVSNIDDGGVLTLVKNAFLVDEVKKYDGRTKQGKLMQEELLEKYSEFVSPTKVTRQRIQYLSGYVTEESANEAGEIAARQIVQIVNSWKNNSWPNTFGIRYPQDDRNDPYFRAFVLGDERFKQENFAKTNEENFNDLLESDEE